jgi:hypothetical protein
MLHQTMKHIVATTICLMLITSLSAQQLKIETLLLDSNVIKTNLVDGALRFPIFKTGNKTIDELLNNDIIKRITSNDYPLLTNDSALITWANEGIVYMNYETTYYQNGIVSFNIGVEGCGAYCTGTKHYFNYNYYIGKPLTLGDIIDTTSGFAKQVLHDKRTQFTQQKVELKKRLKEDPTGFDEETYNWALTYYTDCENEFNFNSFALHPTHLSIICDCYMPHVIQSLAPDIELNYKYAIIKQHLKIQP